MGKGEKTSEIGHLLYDVVSTPESAPWDRLPATSKAYWQGRAELLAPSQEQHIGSTTAAPVACTCNSGTAGPLGCAAHFGSRGGSDV